MQDQRQPTPVERLFAQRMRELRKMRGLSQAEMADQMFTMCGIKLDDSAITRMEKNADGGTGARVLRLGEALAIADVLGVNITEMLRPAAPLEEQIAQARRSFMVATEKLTMAEQQRALAERKYRELMELQKGGMDGSAENLQGSQGETRR